MLFAFLGKWRAGRRTGDDVQVICNIPLLRTPLRLKAALTADQHVQHRDMHHPKIL